MTETYGRWGHLIAETGWFRDAGDSQSRTRKRWAVTVQHTLYGWWEVILCNPAGKQASIRVLETTERGAKGIATRMLRKAAP